MSALQETNHLRTALPSGNPLRGGARPSPRYTRFVGMMKLLLPMLGLGLIIMVVAWPDGTDNVDGFRLSFSLSSDNDSNQLVMVNPRYTGTDSDQRPFTVTAASATQDPQDQRRITLKSPQADLTMKDGTWLTVIADGGVYHQGEERLSLQGPVNIFSDLGYEFHAERALIDLSKGTAESDAPVWGQGPFGSLRADTLNVTERGQRLRFVGSVQMIIRPPGRS